VVPNPAQKNNENALHAGQFAIVANSAKQLPCNHRANSNPTALSMSQ
jgi:hypothetical protein